MKTKLMTGTVLLSSLLLSQSAFAAIGAQSKECQQLEKQMVKSNYAKKTYQKKCTGKKLAVRLPTLRITHKTKEQLEKERLERERKLKAARAKAAAMQQKGSQSGMHTRVKGGFFKRAPRSRFYVGTSFGKSTLKPKVSGGGVSLTTGDDKAYKAYAGFKVKPRFAVEGFYADLGNKGIKTPTITDGKINYKLYGLSGIYMQPFGKRIQGLAKLGVSKAENTVSKGISHKQVKGGNLFAGAGLAFTILPKLSIKAEYEYFDKDIQLISTGLSWQF